MIYAIQKTKVPKSKTSSMPSFFEKIIGTLSFMIFVAQCYYRLNEQRGIYMLNPCHWCLVLE